MTRNDIKELFRYMSANGIRLAKDANRSDMINGYHVAMSDLTMEEAKAAVDRYCTDPSDDHDWWPRSGKLLALVPHYHDSQEQWQLVSKWDGVNFDIGRAGRTRPNTPNQLARMVSQAMPLEDWDGVQFRRAYRRMCNEWVETPPSHRLEQVELDDGRRVNVIAGHLYEKLRPLLTDGEEG